MKRVAVILPVAVLLLTVVLEGVDAGVALKGHVTRTEVWDYEIVSLFGKLEEQAIGRTVTLYDGCLHPVDETHYAASGAVDVHYIRSYDSHGRLSDVHEYSGSGALVGYSLATYEGSTQRFRTYDAAGSLRAASDAELDAFGNVLRATSYDVATWAVESVMVYTYTFEGDMASMRLYDAEGSLRVEVIVIYGSEGMDVVHWSVSYLFGWESFPNALGTRYERTDSEGNWTEKTLLQNEERFGKKEWVPIMVSRRSLTYSP